MFSTGGSRRELHPQTTFDLARFALGLNSSLSSQCSWDYGRERKVSEIKRN